MSFCSPRHSAMIPSRHGFARLSNMARRSSPSPSGNAIESLRVSATRRFGFVGFGRRSSCNATGWPASTEGRSSWREISSASSGKRNSQMPPGPCATNEKPPMQPCAKGIRTAPVRWRTVSRLQNSVAELRVFRRCAAGHVGRDGRRHAGLRTGQVGARHGIRTIGVILRDRGGVGACGL